MIRDIDKIVDEKMYHWKIRVKTYWMISPRILGNMTWPIQSVIERFMLSESVGDVGYLICEQIGEENRKGRI